MPHTSRDKHRKLVETGSTLDDFRTRVATREHVLSGKVGRSLPEGVASPAVNVGYSRIIAMSVRCEMQGDHKEDRSIP
eukprot:757490-Hanusia_phi.AAC.7